MINDNLETLARTVGERLRSRGEVLSTAESCTGGWVAEAITSIPGSSTWFDRGFVTYSNLAKTEMLGVSELILEKHGAVSEAVARAMAQGALEHSQGNWSLSITGVAGPDGGTALKPVGMVCFAWANGAGRTGGCIAHTQHFAGDRQAVRQQAVQYALEGLLEQMA